METSPLKVFLSITTKTNAEREGLILIRLRLIYFTTQNFEPEGPYRATPVMTRTGYCFLRSHYLNS